MLKVNSNMCSAKQQNQIYLGISAVLLMYKEKYEKCSSLGKHDLEILAKIDKLKIN